MNCEQIREAMDTDIRQDIVQRHLSGCADCAEWSSLLRLLGTQPRVKAPADFDARLQARLASEEVKLLALVNSLPPVTAPADFDFRLSGRLAQVKAEKAAWRPLAWLTEFWTNSFSFGQAATAMAAVALIVAVSTMQLTRNSNQPVATEANIARIQTQPPRVVVPQTQVAVPVMRDQIVKAVNRASRQAAPTLIRAVAAPATERMVASTAVERSVYDTAKGQEIKVSGGVAYGQQLKSVLGPKTETVAVAF
jgi:hypothetical protein